VGESGGLAGAVVLAGAVGSVVREAAGEVLVLGLAEDSADARNRHIATTQLYTEAKGQAEH